MITKVMGNLEVVSKIVCVNRISDSKFRKWVSLVKKWIQVTTPRVGS